MGQRQVQVGRRRRARRTRARSTIRQTAIAFEWVSTHALGRAGGARRVDDRVRVVGVDLLLAGRQLAAVALAPALAQLVERELAGAGARSRSRARARAARSRTCVDLRRPGLRPRRRSRGRRSCPPPTRTRSGRWSGRPAPRSPRRPRSRSWPSTIRRACWPAGTPGRRPGCRDQSAPTRSPRSPRRTLRR